jgi:hypothetical protein
VRVRLLARVRGGKGLLGWGRRGCGAGGVVGGNVAAAWRQFFAPKTGWGLGVVWTASVNRLPWMLSGRRATPRERSRKESTDYVDQVHVGRCRGDLLTWCFVTGPVLGCGKCRHVQARVARGHVYMG